MIRALLLCTALLALSARGDFKACYQAKQQTLQIISCTSRDMAGRVCNDVAFSLVDGGVQNVPFDERAADPELPTAGCAPVMPIDLRALGVTARVTRTDVTITPKEAEAYDADPGGAFPPLTWRGDVRRLEVSREGVSLATHRLESLTDDATLSGFAVGDGEHLVLVLHFPGRGNEGSIIEDEKYWVVRQQGAAKKCTARCELVVPLQHDDCLDSAKFSLSMAKALSRSPEKAKTWRERAVQAELRSQVYATPEFLTYQRLMDEHSTDAAAIDAARAKLRAKLKSPEKQQAAAELLAVENLETFKQVGYPSRCR